MTRVKICGLREPADIECAIEAGADALGFVFEPSSPRYVGEDFRETLYNVPPFVYKVAVFGVTPVELSPAAQMCEAIQMVEGPVPQGTHAPALIRAIRLGGAEPMEHALETLGHARAYLIDAYDPQAYGGTGKKVDWQEAARIAELIGPTVPVILAGGLTPDNVADAIRAVRPYAVDVSSGVESAPGVKDKVKIRDFIAAVRSVP